MTLQPRISEIQVVQMKREPGVNTVKGRPYLPAQPDGVPAEFDA